MAGGKRRRPKTTPRKKRSEEKRRRFLGAGCFEGEEDRRCESRKAGARPAPTGASETRMAVSRRRRLAPQLADAGRGRPRGCERLRDDEPAEAAELDQGAMRGRGRGNRDRTLERHAKGSDEYLG